MTGHGWRTIALVWATVVAIVGATPVGALATSGQLVEAIIVGAAVAISVAATIVRAVFGPSIASTARLVLSGCRATIGARSTIARPGAVAAQGVASEMRCGQTDEAHERAHWARTGETS